MHQSDDHPVELDYDGSEADGLKHDSSEDFDYGDVMNEINNGDSDDCDAGDDSHLDSEDPVKALLALDEEERRLREKFENTSEPATAHKADEVPRKVSTDRMTIPPKKVARTPIVWDRGRTPDRKTEDYLAKLPPLFTNAAYFLIKSNNHENVSLAKAKGVWATPPSNTRKLDEAYAMHANVILIFSVRESGAFQGFARLADYSTSQHPPIRWVLPQGLPASRLSRVFWLDWVSRKELPFNRTGDILNSWNFNKPVKIGRDGQPVEPSAGERVCRMFPIDERIDVEQILAKAQERADRVAQKLAEANGKTSGCGERKAAERAESPQRAESAARKSAPVLDLYPDDSLDDEQPAPEDAALASPASARSQSPLSVKDVVDDAEAQSDSRAQPQSPSPSRDQSHLQPMPARRRRHDDAAAEPRLRTSSAVEQVSPPKRVRGGNHVSERRSRSPTSGRAGDGVYRSARERPPVAVATARAHSRRSPDNGSASHRFASAADARDRPAAYEPHSNRYRDDYGAHKRYQDSRSYYDDRHTKDVLKYASYHDYLTQWSVGQQPVSAWSVRPDMIYSGAPSAVIARRDSLQYEQDVEDFLRRTGGSGYYDDAQYYSRDSSSWHRRPAGASHAAEERSGGSGGRRGESREHSRQAYDAHPSRHSGRRSRSRGHSPRAYASSTSMSAYAKDDRSSRANYQSGSGGAGDYYRSGRKY